MGFWRSFVRRHTSPIHPERAKKAQRILSGLYFFTAWNLVGLAFYKLVNNATPPEVDDSHREFYKKLMRSDKATVLQFDGFKLVNEYEIDRTVDGERLIDSELNEARRRLRQLRDPKWKDLDEETKNL